MSNTRHRIFIAINLPDQIKQQLTALQEKFQSIPAKWVKQNNLHITLAFLGYIAEKDIPEIIIKTKEIAREIEPFSINLSKVNFAPKDKIPPRMIWAKGEKIEELSVLQKNLENELSAFSENSLKKEGKNFIPHITLARINAWEFRKIDPEEMEIVDEDVSFDFSVSSIQIMESILKKSGPEYIILESISLSK